MKQTIKFVVAVFGVTVATFGTLSSKAMVRCTGTSGECAKITRTNMTTGVTTTVTLVGSRNDTHN